jgi:hypothetical protein
MSAFPVSILISSRLYYQYLKAFIIPIIAALKPVASKVFNALNFILDSVKEKTGGFAGFIENLAPLFEKLGKFVGFTIEK